MFIVVIIVIVMGAAYLDYKDENERNAAFNRCLIEHKYNAKECQFGKKEKE